MTESRPPEPDDATRSAHRANASDAEPTRTGETPQPPDVSDAPTHSADGTTHTAPGNPSDEMIGDYALLRPLGEGGFGTVYLAQQEAPVRRQVALKVLKAGMGTQQIVARFEAERQALALMEHPNIARIFDAGTTPHGLPFFVMELVRGAPITDHCDKQRLNVRSRLKLMASVCQAVHHAHQKGLIHRDLKPSNVLVTDQDTGPTPKVIDFGIAKVIREGLSDQTTFTQEGQLIGTPAYMSPEQAAGKTGQIDTRTDIYSLGVILFELVAGQLPHDRTGSALEQMRRVADGEIRRPRDVSRRIDRELESILLKALTTNPDQRYTSAAALADDIDNYLAGEPLTARRATTTYFLRKRLRKHWKPIAAAAAVVLATGITLGVMSYNAYHRRVVLPLNSTPPGAALYVDGKLKEGCGVTPCQVVLGPGEHVIELRHSSGDYHASQKTVRVEWGQVFGDAFEPVVMLPKFQVVNFTTEPGGVSVVLRDAASDEQRFRFTTPESVRLPAGRYRITYPERPSAAQDEVLEIVGSTEVLNLNRELERTASAQSKR